MRTPGLALIRVEFDVDIEVAGEFLARANTWVDLPTLRGLDGCLVQVGVAAGCFHPGRSDLARRVVFDGDGNLPGDAALQFLPRVNRWVECAGSRIDLA